MKLLVNWARKLYHYLGVVNAFSMLIGVVIGTLFGLGAADLDKLWALFPKGTSITDWIMAACTIGILFGTWTAANYTKRIWLNEQLFLSLEKLQNIFRSTKIELKVFDMWVYGLKLHYSEQNSRDEYWEKVVLTSENINLFLIKDSLEKIKLLIEKEETKKSIYQYFELLKHLEGEINKINSLYSKYILSSLGGNVNDTSILNDLENSRIQELYNSFIKHFHELISLLYSEMRRIS